MKGFKDVTYEQFKEFVESYPVKLHRDVFGGGDPPLVTFNDFSTGKIWPESVVASHYMAWGPDEPKEGTEFKVKELTNDR